MDSLGISTLVPLGSVLLGAGMTYWLNVRSRRRSSVEDLFNQAITAVAVADSSAHYLRGFARPPSLSDDEHRQLQARIEQTAIETHALRCSEAREALAKVLQFEPAVRQYYQDAEAIVRQPEVVTALLVEARERHLRGHGMMRLFRADARRQLALRSLHVPPADRTGSSADVGCPVRTGASV